MSEPVAYPALFSPIVVGRTELANRVVLLPQGTGLNHDGVPSDRDIAYYQARARGGVGLVICGGTAAHPSSQLRNRSVLEAYDPAAVPALRRRVDAVHRHGSRIVGQLLCLGREMAAEAMDVAPVAPSPARSPRFAYGPHVLRGDEIADHVASYATSARNLIDAGHDGVEIHAAHGYLVAQFLSPATNHRDDAYGGTPDGRRRFLFEIIAAVRAAIGSEPVLGVRLSIDEELADGIGIDDSRDLVAAIESLASVDYLSLTVGVRGTYVKDMSAPQGVALERIAAVKQATTIPVIAAQRITTPAMAEQLLVDGTADLVGLSRALIADPEWAAKARRGDAARIRPCVGVSQECRSHVTGGLSCMVNVDAGQEHAPVDLRRRGTARRVAIIGAGPAGLEAAHLAASRGHRIVLWEREPEVGGQVRLAAVVAARRELLRFIEFQLREAERAGVDIRVGIDATAALIAHERPDVVVVATGARPTPPRLTGRNVIAACEVLRVAPPKDGDIVVCDDGSGFWHACTAAEHLASRGARVVLTTPQPSIGHAVPGESLGPLLRRLFGAGVEIRPFTTALEHDGRRLHVAHAITGTTSQLRADVVVMHEGHTAADSLVAPLRDAGLTVHAIGDCVAPRRITHAVRDATHLALSVL